MTLRTQHLLTLSERIEIDDFVRAVLVFLFDATHQYEGMVVGWRLAKVEPAEGQVGTCHPRGTAHRSE
ncbi:hypothetical protein ACU4GD_33765 [Cupriavidus basilensis]